MRPRIMLDVEWDKDPAIVALGTADRKLAFIKCIGEAKKLRNGGVFRDVAYLKAVIGQPYARAVNKLIEVGLLTVDNSGVVAISTYSRYQVDPKSTERGQRWRARNRGGLTDTNTNTNKNTNTPYVPRRGEDSNATPTRAFDILVRKP